MMSEEGERVAVVEHISCFSTDGFGGEEQIRNDERKAGFGGRLIDDSAPGTWEREARLVYEFAFPDDYRRGRNECESVYVIANLPRKRHKVRGESYG